MEGRGKEMETGGLTDHQLRSPLWPMGSPFPVSPWHGSEPAGSLQQWLSLSYPLLGPPASPSTFSIGGTINKKTPADPPALAGQPCHVNFYPYCKYSLYLAETFHCEVFEARQPSGVKDLKCQKKRPASTETSVVMV